MAISVDRSSGSSKAEYEYDVEVEEPQEYVEPEVVPDQGIDGGQSTFEDAAAPPLVDLSGGLADPGPPSAQELIDQTNALRDELGMAALTAEEETAIEGMSEDERAMYDATLDALERLHAGEDALGETYGPSDYFDDILDAAAAVAGDDGELFVDLVHMAMSEGPSGPILEPVRDLLGSGSHPAGCLLEGMAQTIGRQNTLAYLEAKKYGDQALMEQYAGFADGNASGFNPQAVDADAGNTNQTGTGTTVTHHFGELLQVGSNAGGLVASLVEWGLDQVIEQNPGDVRSGDFAAMLGESVEKGDISPADAAELAKWAYDEDTEWREGNLEAWKDYYNDAHPGSPIP